MPVCASAGPNRRRSSRSCCLYGVTRPQREPAVNMLFVACVAGMDSPLLSPSPASSRMTLVNKSSSGSSNWQVEPAERPGLQGIVKPAKLRTDLGKVGAPRFMHQTTTDTDRIYSPALTSAQQNHRQESPGSLDHTTKSRWVPDVARTLLTAGSSGAEVRFQIEEIGPSFTSPSLLHMGKSILDG